MKRLLALLTVLVSLLLFFVVHPSLASSNILFILDGSGSMWGQVDGVAKITTAKQVMTDLLKDLPKHINVGLMAYGHRSDGDCKDVELLVPLGPLDADRLANRIDSIQPKGKTPLNYALEQSQPLFASLKGQSNNIVLVSDGKETCGGDPCRAAAKLAAADIGLKVHVVGFDVSKEESKQLECIAKEGKGLYFPAKNTQGFRDAMAQVKKEVSEPKEEPKKPEPKEYFFDDFEGEELKEHWEVINPDPDNYIVTEGHLLMVSHGGNLEKENVKNVILLTKELPKGNWVATAKLRASVQGNFTRIYFLLYQDPKTYIAADVGTWHEGKRYMYAQKLLKGKHSGLEKWLGYQDSYLNDKKPDFFLRIAKKGLKYRISWSVDGEKWQAVGHLTMLRIKGRLGFATAIVKGGGASESTVEFDWMRIETLE